MIEVAYTYDDTGKHVYKYGVIYLDGLKDINDYSLAVKAIISEEEFKYIENIPYGKISEIEAYIRGKLNEIDIWKHL